MKAINGFVRLAVTVVFVFSCADFAAAQTTPEAFLASAPPVPQDCCDMAINNQEAFLARVDQLLASLDSEIDRLKEDAQANVERHQEEIKRHHLANAGISEADAEKMANANEAEQMAMADKYLQRQHNISMADIEKLQGMSEEQQAAWAQAHGAQMMAQIQANPQRVQAGQSEAHALMKQAQEQQGMVERLTAGANRVAAQFDELENDPAAKRMREQEIMPLEARVMAMIGAGGQREAAEMDQLRGELRAKKRAYCAMYYPRYRAAYESYLSYVKQSLPEYHRLDQVQAASFKHQSGVAEEVLPQGLSGLEAVRDYVRKLRNVFQFDLRTDMDM